MTRAKINAKNVVSRVCTWVFVNAGVTVYYWKQTLKNLKIETLYRYSNYVSFPSCFQNLSYF